MQDCLSAGGDAVEQCMRSSLPLYDCIAERRKLLLDLSQEKRVSVGDIDVIADRVIYERELNQDPVIKEVIDQYNDRSSEG